MENCCRECPFCGSEKVEICQRMDEETKLTAYIVVCNGCGAAMAFTLAKKERIELQPFTSFTKTLEMWNRRKDDHRSTNMKEEHEKRRNDLSIG